MNRRQFTTISSLGLATSIFPTDMPKPKKVKEVFVHQVYFWMEIPVVASKKAELIEGIKSLTSIKSIKTYHIGTPAGTSRDVIDGTYAISWLTTFASAKDQDAYQIDPIHVAFVEKYKHLWNKVIVYDSITL